MTIHLVENNTGLASYLARSLGEKPGRTITSFPSAEALLPILEEGFPDAIVADLQLPGISGITLFMNLKGRMPKDCRFILLSDLTDGRLVLDFIKRGLRDYVIRDDNALMSIEAILENREEDMLFES